MMRPTTPPTRPRISAADPLADEAPVLAQLTAAAVRELRPSRAPATPLAHGDVGQEATCPRGVHDLA